MSDLTHLDDKGRVRMVDVGEKEVTLRRAVAGASVSLSEEVRRRISENSMKKGNVLETARSSCDACT